MAENGLTDSPHVDEGMLHTWLDGALPTDESAAVEAHVASCGVCSAAAAEARGLIAASSRILSALDDVPGGVVPQITRDGELTTPAAARTVASGARSARSLRSVRHYAPIAAVAAFAIAATLILQRKPGPTPKQNAVAAQRRVTPLIVSAGEVKAPAPVQSSEPAHVGHVDARASERGAPSSSSMVAATTTSPAQVTSQSAAPSATYARATAEKAAAADAGALRLSAPASVMPLPPGSDSLAVTGRVVAATTGFPLGSALVAVLGTSNGTMTDSSGVFTIARLGPGTHTIVARHIGFAAAQIQVSVPVGHPASVTLALPPSNLALSATVVTGVAASTGRAAELAKSPPVMVGARIGSSYFSDEHGVPVRHTVYVLDSGAQVTLAESHPTTIGELSAESAGARAFAEPRAMQTTLRQLVHSVSWVASDGTTLVLSGAFPTAELERLKSQIVR
ncbi:MAG: carboxypeptidase-like regulatory domain-containing protein [Gemmatimonadaceae bacterium]